MQRTCLKSLGGGLVVAAFAAIASAGAQAPEITVPAAARESLAVTVYGNDLALISERRRLQLPAGSLRLAFEDISESLLPESALLEGEGFAVAGLIFDFDTLSPQRMLEAAVGDRVLLARENPTTGEDRFEEAEVLAVENGLVLRVGDRIEINPPGRVVFPDWPGSLRRAPALIAEAEVEQAGEKPLELSYLTGGLAWKADYVLRIDEASGRGSLLGQASITNTSGVDWRDASLRLVAGEVKRLKTPELPRPMARAAEAVLMAEAPMIQEQPAGDFHLYEVGQPVELPDRQTRQVTLLASDDVAIERTYRLEGLVQVGAGRGGEIGPRNAALLLRLENRAEAGLGRPLPGGVVRVYGGGDRLLFLGEDRIKHSAEGSEIEVTTGEAFDVTGIGRTTAFERISDRAFESAQEVRVQNAKESAVTVEVIADLPPGTRMLEESVAHRQETATRYLWPIEVPAKSEQVLTFRYRVSR